MRKFGQQMGTTRKLVTGNGLLQVSFQYCYDFDLDGIITFDTKATYNE